MYKSIIKKNLKLYSIVLVFSLTGCNRDNSKPVDQTPGKVTSTEFISLENKNFSEVMAIKYKSAVLRCQLKSRIGATPNGSVTYLPQSEASFDLKKKSDLPLELSLSARPTVILVDGKKITHELKVTVKLVDLKIKSLVLEDVNDKKTYKMDNSPVLTVDFYAKSTEMPEDNVKADVFAPNQIIYERKKSILLNGETYYGDKYATRDQLDCYVDTEIEENYINDFKVYTTENSQ